MSSIATYYDRGNQRIICKDVKSLEDAVKKAPETAVRMVLDIKFDKRWRGIIDANL